MIANDSQQPTTDEFFAQLGRMNSSLPSQTRFGGYEATESSPNRKSRAASIVSEDAVLGPSKRGKLTSSIQDLNRNFELVGWMLRKHLDYVTECDFHSDTGDDGFDTAVEEFISKNTEAEMCDIRGKHTLDELYRLQESETIVAGDVLALRTADECLQLIESDLLRNPENATENPNANWVHGVKLDPFERHTRYCVWKRTRSGVGYESPREVATDNAKLMGHFTRLSQTRGVSPLASAVNRICDLYESFGYAINKAKLSQLMGFFFKSAAIEGMGSEKAEGDKYAKIKFGNGSVFQLEGEPGDELDLVASNTPSTEFQAFMSAMIHVSLLVLDLPFSFYDETQANFFGNRAAWLHYSRSCGPKRRKHIRARKWYSDWLIGNAILDGRLKPSRSANLSAKSFKWVATGMPWWNPGQEINADVSAMSAGLDNPYRICEERGRGQFEDNLKQIARAKQFAESLGIVLSWDKSAVEPLFKREAVKS